MKAISIRKATWAAIALFITTPAIALAGDLKAPLVACPANKTAIGDVGSCGKIWKLKSGEAKLSDDGKLKVDVKGLVLNDPTTGEFNGTPDGVDAVAAAVLCTGPDGVAVAAQTDVVPLAKNGDAKINAKVSLPKGCETWVAERGITLSGGQKRSYHSRCSSSVICDGLCIEERYAI